MLLQTKLQSSELFSEISPDNINLLVNCLHLRQVQFKSGEYIHHVNDIYDSIGFIVSGKVQMIGEDFWGNRNLIQEFESLQFYGDAHSMTGFPMFFNIVAIKDTEILFINTKKIISTCQSACFAHQQLISNFMLIISSKKLSYMRKADFLSQRTIRDKVSMFLSEQSRLKGSNSFTIKYNRQHLADYLAVDRSSLSRELSKMQDEGILSFDNNHFTLHVGKQ